MFFLMVFRSTFRIALSRHIHRSPGSRIETRAIEVVIVVRHTLINEDIWSVGEVKRSFMSHLSCIVGLHDQLAVLGKLRIPEQYPRQPILLKATTTKLASLNKKTHQQQTTEWYYDSHTQIGASNTQTQQLKQHARYSHGLTKTKLGRHIIQFQR